MSVSPTEADQSQSTEGTGASAGISKQDFLALCTELIPPAQTASHTDLGCGLKSYSLLKKIVGLASGSQLGRSLWNHLDQQQQWTVDLKFKNEGT